MIDYSVNIKPYSSVNECGDFFEYIELDEYFLLIVGDIGGHGSYRVYQIAQSIKKVIQQNSNENIKNIIKTIHQSEFLKDHGMTIFIAQIFKNSPLLSYGAIGNTRSLIFRNNNFIQLHTQDGILGYDIPSTIKTNLLKLSNNDILIVATDGISLHQDKLVEELKRYKDATAISNYCITHHTNDDDALCAVLKFDISNSNSFLIHKEIISNKKKPETISETNKLIQINKKVNTNKKEYPILVCELSSHINLLDQKYLLISGLRKNGIKLLLDKIVSLSTLSQIKEVKIRTFLYETIKHSIIDIYLYHNIMQIYVHNITHIKNSLEFLFKKFYIKDDSSCIINIELDSFTRLNKDKFDEFHQMLSLGLNEEQYQKYKENETQMNKMAEQTRLAAMGEMIGNIAHQWRQPLSVISTSASGLMVQKEYGVLSDEIFFKFCSNIDNSTQYLSKTIDDFRDFIQGDTKEETFTLKHLITKAITLVEYSIKENNINLIINAKIDIELFGPFNMLIQVIVNIINNAKDILIERQINNKIILIDLEKENNNINIIITDNAGGIPQNIKSKIFDAYFTTKHKSQGTGLGLNMAYNIITKSFKGSLIVENKTFMHQDIEYTGAKFIISIPI